MSQEIEILKDRLKFSDDALAAVEAKLVRAEAKIRHLEQCRYPENAGEPTVDFNELAWRADRQDMLDEIAKLSNTVNEYAGTIKKLNENGRKLQESLDTSKQIQSLQEAELERTKKDVEYYKSQVKQQKDECVLRSPTGSMDRFWLVEISIRNGNCFSWTQMLDALNHTFRNTDANIALVKQDESSPWKKVSHTIKETNERLLKLEQEKDEEEAELLREELVRVKETAEFYRDKANQQLDANELSAKLESLRHYAWTLDYGVDDEVRLRAGMLLQVSDWLRFFEKSTQFWANDAESFYGQRLLDSIRDCQDMPCVENKLGLLQSACNYVLGTLKTDDMEQVEQGLPPF